MSDFIKSDLPMIIEACEAVAILNDQYIDITKDESILPFKLEYWYYSMVISFMDIVIWDSENDGIIYRYYIDEDGEEIETVIPLMEFLVPKVQDIVKTITTFKV
jgi:hypothetical protein